MVSFCISYLLSWNCEQVGGFAQEYRRVEDSFQPLEDDIRHVCPCCDRMRKIFSEGVRREEWEFSTPAWGLADEEHATYCNAMEPLVHAVCQQRRVVIAKNILMKQ